MARERGLAWHVHVPEGGAWVRGDRTRLRQVALNLISNAVKFTDRGSIRIDLSVGDDSATVAISDTGPGVPLADQRQIFEEFRTSERTADRAYGGLGLGLTICKQLIERHGGTIGVRSPGEGGSPIRSKLSRRMSVARSASGDGARFCFSRRARMNASIGVRTQPLSLATGSAD